VRTSSRVKDIEQRTVRQRPAPGDLASHDSTPQDPALATASSGIRP
jgi:hypothetical protein